MPQESVVARDVSLAESLRQAKVDAAVINALETWQQREDMRIVFDRWLTPGKSKAVLASVALTGQHVSGKVVMKVCPPGRDTGREPGRHKTALREAPGEFAERHLVRQPVGPVEVPGGSKVMFQEIAGGSLRDVRPLSAERGRKLPDVVHAVARSLRVYEVNRARGAGDGLMTARSVVVVR